MTRPALTFDELVRVAIAVVATAFGQMLIAIPFIVHTTKNTRLSPSMRVVWPLLFVFVGEFADPIYWAKHVCPKA